MTFKVKRTAGQGVEFEIRSGVSDGGYQWGLPARIYRKVARDVIEGLLAENRQLRHGRLRPTWPQPSFKMWLYGTVLSRLAPKEDS